jgi:phosphate transport system substrate-binding protein
VKKTILGDWWKLAAAGLAVLLLAWMFWPSSSARAGSKVSSAKPIPVKPTPAVATPALVVVPTTPPPPEIAARVILRLHGPEAVSSDLLSGLVEAFLRKEGFAGVETKAGTAPRTRLVRGQRPGANEPEAIEIKSSREQEAFVRLAKGECDFAVALRVPTGEEETRMSGVVDVNSKACVHVLALDAPAVIVHKGNPIESVTTAQLEAIWKAETDNWAALGGATAPIQVHLLEDNHPQTDLFPSFLREHLVTRGRVHRHASPKALADAVAGTPEAIGIVPMRFIAPAHAVAVKPGADAQSLMPSQFTTATEDYAFTRRILLYNASSHGPVVSQFLRFIASGEGQDIVGKLGYADQNLRPRREDLPALYKQAKDMPAWIIKGLVGAERLSANFRFATGKSELDVKALADIERVVPRLAEQDMRGKQLLLAGFADSRGGDTINCPLSVERARTVSRELQKLGVTAAAAIGLCSALPVAPNTDETGWEKNRRVELWLLEVKSPPPR